MKLLLLLVNEDVKDAVEKTVAPLGFDVIWYRYVQKAMDNLEEISPDAVIVSARDFPRHWKIFATYAGTAGDRPFPILLVKNGETFGADEQKKAEMLGIDNLADEDENGLIDDGGLRKFLNKIADLASNDNSLTAADGGLEEMAPAAAAAPDTHVAAAPPDAAVAATPAAPPAPIKHTRPNFVFSDPASGIIITGGVKDLTADSLDFSTDEHVMAEQDAVVPQCSLHIGENLLSPVCRVASIMNSDVGCDLTLSFESFPADEKEKLLTYLG